MSDVPKKIEAAQLKRAIMRSVASSTAIETGRSIAAIERKLSHLIKKAPPAKSR